MFRPVHSFTRLVATAALVATVALGVAPAAFGDDWARDRASALAVQELDPAIRVAIAARVPDVPDPRVVAPLAPADDGFAWGAAGIGLAVGVAGMCVLLGCVTLVRHDGRLRSV